MDTKMQLGDIPEDKIETVEKNQWREVPIEVREIVLQLINSKDKDNILVAVNMLGGFSPFLKYLYQTALDYEDEYKRESVIQKINDTLWKKD